MHKRSELYPAVLFTVVAFLMLLALSLASTTWAAPGEQGTIGEPPTATPHATSTPRISQGCSDCAPTLAAPTATPLPRLPVTGSDLKGGSWGIGIPLLALFGAMLLWQGLHIARRNK